MGNIKEHVNSISAQRVQIKNLWLADDIHVPDGSEDILEEY